MILFFLHVSTGKTTLLTQLLLQAETMFTIPPARLYFVYSHWQDAYVALRNKYGENITFSEEIPSESELVAAIKGAGGPTIFVCDDKGAEMKAHEEFFTALCTRLGHHHNMSSIILLQDAGMNGKLKTTLARNCHVHILLRSPKERGFVKSLGMQLSEYAYVMSSYDMATSMPFGYLVLDLHPHSDALIKLRTKILPNERQPCIIYRPAKK